ncbi:MAG: hypothetical protein Q8P16_00085, partial [bacterium]|nr:hypothetical protein [bacterium]
AFLLFALPYFVSIPNVLANMLNVKVGELAPYIFGVFLNTEIWTLFILGGLILTALSLRLCLRSFHVRNMQAV